MRITWNISELRFEIIVPYDLRDEVSLLRKAKFSTTGPPTWVWHTSKASSLNKLRKLGPKSGLEITELALQKYTFLNKQEQSKLEIKKQFKKAQQAAQLPKFEEYFDQELQLTCFVIKPLETKFVWSYHRPAPPTKRCLGCDDPMYFPFDDRGFCIWCEKSKIILDKFPRI